MEATRAAPVVVGLGNPGPSYAETRHNVGHMVVDHLAARLGGRFQPRGPALVATVAWRSGPLHLAKLLTFMNASGPALARLLAVLDLDVRHLVLVHDDVDLPFGTVRVRRRGRAGGHHGVASVLEALGTLEIRRVKVGVGRPADREAVVAWVLSAFDPEERSALPAVLGQAADRVLALAAEAGL